MLPLVGAKVVEFTKDIGGFYAGMILADLGAEVVKIEKPQNEPSRNAGPMWRGAIFAAFNRNKKSVAIDLKSSQGKEIMRKLLKNADVFLEDMSRETINELGLSYGEVSKLNPMIAHVSVKDCLDGPYQSRNWSDGTIEAEGGITSTTGWPDPHQPLVAENPPVRLGVPVPSTAAGIYAAMWAMGTLYTRKKEGRGDYVQVGKLESTVSMIQQWVIDFSIGKFFEKHAARNYKTKDGGWVYYNIVNSDEYWAIFCKATGVSPEDLKATEKAKDRSLGGTAGFTDKVNQILEERSAAFTKADIWKIIIDSLIPAGAVNDIKTVVDEDPHFKATKFFAPMTASPEVALTPDKKEFLTPMLPLASVDYNPDIVKTWKAPPKLGEHTEEVLRMLGYSDGDVAKLRKDKIVWP